MTARVTAPVASPTTAASNAFVAAHIESARALGRSLAVDVDEPSAFAGALRSGLGPSRIPAYRAGQQLVAPGIGPTLGVRTPLLAAVYRARARAAGRRPARLLVVAEALARDEIRELRWLASWCSAGCAGRSRADLAGDPADRRDADDWITVDTLAGVAASGILVEPYRWAELEQLVYSRSRWERRLVGSTIATLPHRGHPSGRSATTIWRGLALVGHLIGDAEPDVQKALSWALRELAV